MLGNILKLKLGANYKVSLKLIRYDKTVLSHLKDAQNIKFTIGLNETFELSFNIPLYVEDTISRKKVKNIDYDLVKEERIVELSINGVPSILFYIQDINDTTDSNLKTATCYSKEKIEFNDYIVMESATLPLAKDPAGVDKTNGIFDKMETDIGWQYYCDEKARLENSEVTTSKYRYFDTINNHWIDFLKDGVCENYNTLLFFDAIEKKLYAYDNSAYGNKINFVLTDKNILKNIKRSSTSKDVVTKLIVTGKDNLSMASANPLGEYVLDYSYFENDMSDKLREGLKLYYSKIDKLFIEWNNINTELIDLQSELNDKNDLQVRKDKEIDELRTAQSELLGKASNSEITAAKYNLQKAQNELLVILRDISYLNAQIKAKIDTMDSLSLQMQIENITDDNGNLIFDEDMKEELRLYTKPNTESNENFFTTQGLYSYSLNRIKEVCKPAFTLDVETKNVIGGDSEFPMEINLGDWMYAANERFQNGKEEIRFVGYTYNDGEITLKFSNTDKKFKETKFGSAISKANKTDRVLSSKRYTWDNYMPGVNFASTMMKQGLNMEVTNIFSANNNNKFEMIPSGFWITDANNPNNLIVITNSSIVTSHDGLATADACITSEGVIGKTIIGEILAGNKLTITTENGDVLIDSNGLTVRNKNGRTTIDGGKVEAESVYAENVQIKSASSTGKITFIQGSFTNGEFDTKGNLITRSISVRTEYGDPSNQNSGGIDCYILAVSNILNCTGANGGQGRINTRSLYADEIYINGMTLANYIKINAPAPIIIVPPSGS
jgi:hypothetical protein